MVKNEDSAKLLKLCTTASNVSLPQRLSLTSGCLHQLNQTRNRRGHPRTNLLPSYLFPSISSLVIPLRTPRNQQRCCTLHRLGVAREVAPWIPRSSYCNTSSLRSMTIPLPIYSSQTKFLVIAW